MIFYGYFLFIKYIYIFLVLLFSNKKALYKDIIINLFIFHFHSYYYQTLE